MQKPYSNINKMSIFPFRFTLKSINNQIYRLWFIDLKLGKSEMKHLFWELLTPDFNTQDDFILRSI